MTTLGELGEGPLIDRLKALFPTDAAVRTGIGDDTAVIAGRGGVDLLLTSDAVIEGRHFTAADDPGAVGHKAVARVLSDLAAMGGAPRWALVDFTAPATLPVATCEAMWAGLAATAEAAGLSVVGGDTTQSDRVSLHVFALGEVPAGTAVLRSGAGDGDAVFVTGQLGGSGAGRHLQFTPRLAEGQWLREQGWASSMIDLSDGLATDLRHLLEAGGVGAHLQWDDIPVAAEAGSTEQALTEGEDFELLFTVPADKEEAFAPAWAERFALSCTRVGRIAGEAGTCLVSRGGQGPQPLTLRGFSHFDPAQGGA